MRTATILQFNSLPKVSNSTSQYVMIIYQNKIRESIQPNHKKTGKKDKIQAYVVLLAYQGHLDLLLIFHQAISNVFFISDKCKSFQQYVMK